MKPFIKVTLLLFAFFLPTMILSQTLDEILNNHFAAINQSKLSTVQTIVTKGKAGQMGLYFQFTQIQKRPLKTYLEMELPDMRAIQVFNGSRGWAVEPWTGSKLARELDEAEIRSLKKQAGIEGDLYNWKNRGHKLELAVKEEFDGSPVYSVRLEKPDGSVFFYLLDEKSYFILARISYEETDEGWTANTTVFGDYKNVGGVVLPHSVEILSDDEILVHYIYESIELNKSIPDSKFDKPVYKD